LSFDRCKPARLSIANTALRRCGLLLVVTAIGTGLALPAAWAQEPPAFSGERAMELVIAQCELGPRIPGSAANAQLRKLIVAMAHEAGLRATSLCFEADDPQTGAPLELCNIVVSAGPSGGDRLWLGAHFDTRPICDKDPDPAKQSLPVTGANDGGSGTAILMHLIELLGTAPPPTGVDLLFFDGEDSGTAGSVEGFCLGSGHLAASWQDFGGPLAEGVPRGLIVLDMVGDRTLTIPREGYSDRYAKPWLDHVFQRAEELGLPAFINDVGPAVYDDHLPFLRQGIPAIDLIDFDYSPWHTDGDRPEACSGESLGQVGRLMVDLIYFP